MLLGHRTARKRIEFEWEGKLEARTYTVEGVGAGSDTSLKGL